MQTEFTDEIKNSDAGRQADEIVRRCVHCGFCNATCPTYQLLGDERDGPRGRIYLIKSLLEGKDCAVDTQRHLDRCLTCRSCETTCPSGVEYGRLLEIGREHLKTQTSRTPLQTLQRKVLIHVCSQRQLFRFLFRIGSWFRPVLPKTLQQKFPRSDSNAGHSAGSKHSRRVILFQGCVQPALTPDTNQITARLLDRLGVSVELIRQEKCCAALPLHLDDNELARNFMRANIDLWYEKLQQGIEAIVVTASACGLMIKDYADQLADDEAYADKAKRVAERCLDISEFLAREDRTELQRLLRQDTEQYVFQSPCTLQHGQKLNGVVESLLQSLGIKIATPFDAYLCCGSAGTYSIFQPELSNRLRQQKLEQLNATNAAVILTANIGCQYHLLQASDVPVRHWISVFAGES